jgi:hypothetical protein
VAAALPGFDVGVRVPDLLSGGLGGDAALRSADLTVVRPDGMRIAVEITGSISRNFGVKVDRWAETLAETDPDRTGLAVVFVDAGGPDRPVGVRTNMWNSVRHNVARAAQQVPGAVDKRVPQRMAAARWDWWFPQSRAGSPAFRNLTCIRPTGTADDRWDIVLLDPADLLDRPGDDADASDTAAAAVANCAALLGVPHWLRERHQPPDFDQILRQRAGVTTTPKLLYLDRKTMRRTRTESADRPPGRPRKVLDVGAID